RVVRERLTLRVAGALMGRGAIRQAERGVAVGHGLDAERAHVRIEPAAIPGTLARLALHRARALAAIDAIGAACARRVVDRAFAAVLALAVLLQLRADAA